MTTQNLLEKEHPTDVSLTPATQADDSGFTNRQRILIMIPLLLGGFIALLNETLLNVAFPQLMESLQVPMGTVQWLGTAYMLIIGILVPVAAFLLKTFSTRKLYVAAMVLFSLGTLACGLSTNFAMLLIARGLQGVGTGMLIPIMMDTIMAIYPLSKRGTAMGVSMMVVVAAPGIGPTVAGLILQYLSWPWLFFAMLPFSVAAIVMGIFFLGSFSELTRPRIDLFSILLSTIGFGGLIFGICAIETLGFLNGTVFLSLLCGVIGLTIFSRRQLKLKEPMLELRTLRYPVFTVGTGIIFISFMIPFAVNIILPTYMQSVLGVSPFMSGFALMPGCILCIIFNPVAGKLYDRIGARLPVCLGFAALIISMFFLSRIPDTTTPLVLITVLQALMSTGIAFIFTPAQICALNQIPKAYHAHGIAILNTTSQIASAFGSSLFIGLMGAVEVKRLAKFTSPNVAEHHAAIISGVHVAFTAALVMVIIGLILSFFIKQKDGPASSKLIN